MRPQSEQSFSSLGSISGLEGDPSEMDEMINPEKEGLETDQGEIEEKDHQSTSETQLTKEDLRVLQNVIDQTQVPTWFSRVPHNFGSAGAGSLKAADWLIL
jgi:hypothetical protein